LPYRLRLASAPTKLSSRLVLADLTGDPPLPPDESGDPLPRSPAAGLSVLLVEDQTIIALDTESMLLELGAAHVHAVTTADAALTWLRDAAVDVAVLDIALGHEMSYPVGDMLLARDTPFVFTTGYGDTSVMPAQFSKVPVVHKPYTANELASALTHCLSGRRQG